MGHCDDRQCRQHNSRSGQGCLICLRRQYPYVRGVRRRRAPGDYVYNGQGQRVKKVEATGDLRTFVFHYGPRGELLGETVYDQYGVKIRERDYLWLDMLPLAQSERTFSGSTVTSDLFVYLHADQLNTPRLATNRLERLSGAGTAMPSGSEAQTQTQTLTWN